MRRFVEGVDRGQTTLFPECLEDWIGEDNPARRRRRLRKYPRALHMPFDLAWVETKFVLQYATCPNGGRLLIFWYANPLTA